MYIQKGLLLGACFFSFSPVCDAAIPGIFCSFAEINELQRADGVAQALQFGRLTSVQKIDKGYELKTEHCIARVDIDYPEPKEPGTRPCAEFNLTLVYSTCDNTPSQK